jgi:F-type H+-transporting ATPase subunit b
MRTRVSSALAGGVATFAVAGTAAAASGGMPQLNYHDFVPQLVWLAIAFVTLYLVMSRFAVPRVAETLATRQGKIESDLAAAERANEEARALIATYESRLAEAREEARRLMRGRAETDNAAAAARFAKLHDRLAQQIAEAEKRIAAQRDDVMAGLEHLAKDIGQDVYAKLAGEPADPAALDAEVAAAAKGGSR